MRGVGMVHEWYLVTTGLTVLWDPRGKLLTARKQVSIIGQSKIAIIIPIHLYYNSPLSHPKLFFALFREISLWVYKGHCHPLLPLLKWALLFPSKQVHFSSYWSPCALTRGNAWPGWVASLTSVPVILTFLCREPRVLSYWMSPLQSLPWEAREKLSAVPLPVWIPI